MRGDSHVALGFAVCLALWACANTENPAVSYVRLDARGLAPITSSDLVLSFSVDASGSLGYRLGTIEGATINHDTTKTAAAPDSQYYLRNSRIGIELAGARFLDLVEITEVDLSEGRSSYALLTGKQTEVDKPYKSAVLTLRNRESQEAKLEVRLYADGFAYRYRFDDLDINSPVVLSEYAEFVLPKGVTVWRQPYDTVTTYSPGYEQYWGSAPAEQPAANDRGYVLPLYAYSEDRHILIHESGVEDQYFASHLRNDRAAYHFVPPLEREANGLYDTLATLGSKRYTPWRIVAAGKSAQTILATTLVTDVAPPQADLDFSWVRPGHAAWSWWSDWDSPQDYKKQVRFIDFAAEQGWQYVLVDANWERMRGGDVSQLAAYAKTKNVGLLLWYNSGGPHNDVTEGPRDRMHLPGPRREEFARIAAMGVAGVKIDFFQSDKQGVVRQYTEILADAADAHLLVNFHGCTAPRGWQRTWPNLVSMEAVVGGESYQFKAGYPERAPGQHTILPLTRNAVGPMDYTPVTFTDRKFPHVTTAAHELALAVLFETGVVHYADDASRYRDLPQETQRFLATVPTTWDEVCYLGGVPGEYIAIMRRSGGRAYIAVLNGTSAARTVTLPASALSSETFWTVFSDGNNGRPSHEEFMLPTAIELAPYGGFVAIDMLGKEWPDGRKVLIDFE